MLKTILLALDCSDGSQSIIQALDILQVQPQTKIILAHVLPAPTSESELAADRPHESPESLYQQAQQQLQAYRAQIRNSAIEIVSGDASEEIIRLANIHQADLIVIGTRGLKGVDRVIEGSVSSQVVADAPCSVLVVKS
ncbi:MAG: universal stress protein [Hydrococcus sp. C42_A2020_068]|uniref:universal stress protein n=1 Tax=Pleurocapsa sp. PCC 7327 TaxID=118163 RepID=UPI00029F9F5A|nr:universal stress protein [Pleurocapsa sp. PCC 7327]AFY75942.1 universal stress protein UspA-like protein [Pleurocapsa sp. PCC 7327]MBF2021813.1 universal stress protein [Hydrococcus sp. C42_A2020_068]